MKSEAIDCSRARELFAGYLDGGLEPQAQTLLRAHLKVCEACKADLREHVEILAPIARSGHRVAPRRARRRGFLFTGGRGGGASRLRWRLFILALFGIAAFTWGDWYPHEGRGEPEELPAHPLPGIGEWLECSASGWRLYVSSAGHRIAVEPGTRARVLQLANETLWWEGGELRVEGSGAPLHLEVGSGWIDCGSASFAARVLEGGVEVRVERGFVRLGNAHGEARAEGGEVGRLSPRCAPLVAPMEAAESAGER